MHMSYVLMDIRDITASVESANLVSGRKAWVLVYPGGNRETNRWTSVVDGLGGNIPCWKWSDHFSFLVEEAALKNRNLVFEIMSKGAFGDRCVGLVIVSLRELLNAAGRVAEYQVRPPPGDPFGEPSGALRFSYEFLDMIGAPAETVSELIGGPAHVGAITAYPRQAGVGMAMRYGEQASYGYPPLLAHGPAPPLYGHAPPVVHRRGRQNIRFWLRAGLLGLPLVRDMFPDDGDEADYDAASGF